MHVYLNGDIVSADQATVPVFDRGFLFGDGVYETIQYFNRVGVGMDLHIARLKKSMDDAGIRGFDASRMEAIGRQLLEHAGAENAIYYLQVTRGVQRPRFHRPAANLTPTIFGYISPTPALEEFPGPQARRAITLEDDRWGRCGIKGLSLMANVLAQITCEAHDADEAILHRAGSVTEGTMTNVFAIRGDRLSTPPIEAIPEILAGVTRQFVLDVASDVGLQPVVEPIAADDLARCDELLITSSRRLLDSVVTLDDSPVGAGDVGPHAARLYEALRTLLADRCRPALH